MNPTTLAPNFANVTTIDGVARALQISTPLLEMVLTTEDPSEIYRLHEIPKRARRKETISSKLLELADGTAIEVTELRLPETRQVWESLGAPLKLAHKSAALQLSKFLYKNVAGFPHPNAYGYIAGKSTRDNAERHVGATRIVSADIENFFPTIKMGVVEQALLNAGMTTEGAAIIARFLTIDGKLAPGINASPLIANLVALPLDTELTKICASGSIIYTRYADDLTFSSKDSAALLTDLEIDDVLRRHGFRLNKKKYRTSKRGQKHYVTGLSVSDAARPHAPKKLKRRLRQELHYIERDGLHSHLTHLDGKGEQQTINRIDGMVNYISSVEPNLSKNLRTRWKTIREEQSFDRSYSPRPYDLVRKVKWFVDETELKDATGNRYLALVCAEMDDSDYIEKLVRRFSIAASEDIYLPPETALKLRNQGPHWADLNRTQRQDLVNLLSVIECRCAIAVDRQNPEETYEQSYLRLLAIISDQMMRSLDDATLHISIEQNKSKVSAKKIDTCIQSIYLRLIEANQRRPILKPKLEVLKKGESLLLTVADALAGVFRDYAQFDQSNEQKAFHLLLFQRIDSRYKIIFDVARKKVFTRNSPFTPWGWQDAAAEPSTPSRGT